MLGILGHSRHPTCLNTIRLIVESVFELTQALQAVQSAASKNPHSETNAKIPRHHGSGFLHIRLACASTVC